LPQLPAFRLSVLLVTPTSRLCVSLVRFGTAKVEGFLFLAKFILKFFEASSFAQIAVHVAINPDFFSFKQQPLSLDCGVQR